MPTSLCVRRTVVCTWSFTRIPKDKGHSLFQNQCYLNTIFCGSSFHFIQEIDYPNCNQSLMWLSTNFNSIIDYFIHWGNTFPLVYFLYKIGTNTKEYQPRPSSQHIIFHYQYIFHEIIVWVLSLSQTTSPNQSVTWTEESLLDQVRLQAIVLTKIVQGKSAIRYKHPKCLQLFKVSDDCITL